MVAAGIVLTINAPVTGPPKGFLQPGQENMWFYSAGSYHFLTYAFDAYGNPLAKVNATLGFHSGGPTRIASVMSNKSGYSSTSIIGSLGPDNSAHIVYNAIFPALYNQPPPLTEVQGFYPHVSAGKVYFIGTRAEISPIIDSSNRTTDLLVVLEGTNGTIPAGFEVYYNFNSTSLDSIYDAPYLEEQGMQFLGTITGIHATFKLPSPIYPSGSVNIGVFNTRGKLVLGAAEPAQIFPVYYGAGDIPAVLFGGALVVGIATAYYSFKKPRRPGHLTLSYSMNRLIGF
jgi:hypothetical protein